jgi:hypothetical protein
MSGKPSDPRRSADLQNSSQKDKDGVDSSKISSCFPTISSTSLFSLRRVVSLQGRFLLFGFRPVLLRRGFPRAIPVVKAAKFTHAMATLELTPPAPPKEQEMSLEDIEAKISALTLLQKKMVAEAEEAKKSKKNKKKAKSSKLDVKVPKVHLSLY